MKKDKLLKRKEELYQELENINKKIQEIEIGKLKEKYLGQFVKYYDFSMEESTPIYIWVTDIWKSNDTVFVEGLTIDYFSSEIFEENYIRCDFHSQNRMTSYNIIDEKWQENHLQIISKEDFIKETTNLLTATFNKFTTYINNKKKSLK